MRKYSTETKNTIRNLRSQGYTYSEIQKFFRLKIPYGSLNYICKNVKINRAGQKRLDQIFSKNRTIARAAAVVANKKKFNDKLLIYRQNNQPIRRLMSKRDAQLIALAMLYWGEGAKWKSTRSLKLGSTDPKIILFYMQLMRSCFGIKTEHFKARIQQRADQNTAELEQFWSELTSIPISSFYPSYIDKRTIGKPTNKDGYKGVCTLMCPGTHIQLELEQITDIISEAMRGISAAG